MPVRTPPELPISQLATRTLLLAWSYIDARFAKRQHVDVKPTFGPKVREYERNRELWSHGSYAALEDALEQLRAESRARALWFWDAYIDTPGPFRPTPPRSPELSHAVSLMPRFVYVPQEVSEAAGYRPAEAERWARR